MKKLILKRLKASALCAEDLNRSKGGNYYRSDMAKTIAKWWDRLEKAFS